MNLIRKIKRLKPFPVSTTPLPKVKPYNLDTLKLIYGISQGMTGKEIFGLAEEKEKYNEFRQSN